MKNNTHMIFHIGLLAAGLIIGVVNIAVLDGNVAVVSISAGLIAYGIASLIRDIRYCADPQQAKRTDIRNRDERNIFIAEKARSMSFVITILGLCLSGIILQLLGREAYGQLCLFIVCGACILYFVIYLLLRRKY